MGLSVSLANALTGMKTTQDGLTVLSRNVANSGTAGYHRQNVVLKDMNGGSGSYSSFVGTKRAFVSSLERAYTREVSGMGYADVRNTFMERLETALGKPGDAISLDTLLQNFNNSLQALAASPEDYATRATTVSSAQALAQQLNSLSSTVQELRQETEIQISAEVDVLNQSLNSLKQVNERLADYSLDESSRMSVLDERDRLISKVADIMDVQVDYRSNDTVSLMTHSGLSLLDQGATQFSFTPAGSLSPNSLYSIDDAENGVGVLTAYTPSGLKLDVVDQNILKSGRLSGLIELRDETLVQAQAQLDSIAAAMSQALSTKVTDGIAATTAGTSGFDIDTTSVLSGNEIAVSYTHGGQTYDVRVVRVDDSNNLPMDYTTATGERVVGVSFSAGAGSVASQLNTILGPAISFAATGDTLEVRDDGGVNSSITSVTSYTTSQSTQDDGTALNLFTDLGNQPFTNSLDGDGQVRGYAARISVNTNIANDNSLLVQYQTDGTLGDSSRVDYMLNRLESANYTPDNRQYSQLGSYSLSGNIQGLVQQVINFQGDQISAGAAALDNPADRL